MELKISDLPPQLESIALRLGIEKTTELFEEFGGTTIYFHTKKMVYKEARDREIMRKYTGFNVKELSNLYNLSDVYIRSIIRKKAQVNE